MAYRIFGFGLLEIIIIFLILLMLIRIAINVRKLYVAKKDIEGRRKTVRDGRIVDRADAESGAGKTERAEPENAGKPERGP